MMKKIVLSLLVVSAVILAGRTAVFGQPGSCKITGIATHQNKVSITCELSGSPDEKYIVYLYLQRENDPNSLRKLEKVEGDVGEEKQAGAKLTIVWDNTELSDVVEGARYQFAIQLRTVQGGGFPWYLYAGAAAVGGVVYFAVKPESKTETPGIHAIPFPPSR